MPIEELIRLICEESFAGPEWGEEDEAALWAYVGEVGRRKRAGEIPP